MRSHINIAVPPDADTEMTKKLLDAIREKHAGYDLRITESTNGKYHWDGGYVHPAESARSQTITEDAHGGLVASESYVSLIPLGSEITSIISDVTGHTR
jgi:hypothetical protein